MLATPGLCAAPANDAFVEREFIKGGILSAGISTIGAGADWSEPAHAGNSAGSSVWWSWTPGIEGTAVVDTMGSDFDTVLAIYEGKNLREIEWVAANDDAGLSRTSRVTFNANAQTTYLIAVDGFDGATGSLRVSAHVNPGTLIFSASETSVTETEVAETPERLGAGTVIGGAPRDGHTDAAWRTLNFDSVGEGRSKVRVGMGLNLSVTGTGGRGAFFLLFYNRFGSFLSGLEFDLSSQKVFRHDGLSRYPTNKRFPVGKIADLEMQIDFRANTWEAAFGDDSLFKNVVFHNGEEVADLGSLVLARAGGKQNSVATAFVELEHFQVVGLPDDLAPSNSPGAVQLSRNPDGILVSWDSNPGVGEYKIWRESATGIQELLGTTNKTSFLDEEAQATKPVRYKIVSAKKGLVAVSANLVIPADPDSTTPLRNLSTRGLVRNGNPMIMGFVLKGTGSRRFLLRAIGPGLAALGVNNPLAAARFGVQRLGGPGVFAPVTVEPGWDGNSNVNEISEMTVSTSAFPLSAGSLDAAAIVTLEPGAYTATITEASANDGVVLFEIYSEAGSGPSMSSFSTRGYVGSGQDALIGGLVVEGSDPQWFLIRGVGPSLAAFGMSNFVVNPVISVHEHDGSPQTFRNDTWWVGDSGHVARIREAEVTGLAFPLENQSEDAALLIELAPGVYTVQLNASPGSGPGDGLIEIYHLE